MDTATSTYLSTTDCAREIRVLLKAAFPGTKFSVRSSRYAGGSSIRVGWTDGPRQCEVDAIAKQLEGSRFDGMTDMKESKGPRLVNGRMVSPAVDYVFCERTVSDFAWSAAFCEQMIRQRCMLSDGGTGRDYFCNSHVSDLARAMVHDAIFTNGVYNFDEAFNRIVLRRST